MFMKKESNYKQNVSLCIKKKKIKLKQSLKFYDDFCIQAYYRSVSSQLATNGGDGSVGGASS